MKTGLEFSRNYNDIPMVVVIHSLFDAEGMCRLQFFSVESIPQKFLGSDSSETKEEVFKSMPWLNASLDHFDFGNVAFPEVKEDWQFFALDEEPGMLDFDFQE
jgi:hypothetical protein